MCTTANLGVDGDGLGVRIVDRVTRLMVARVLLHPGSSMEESKRLVQNLPKRSVVAPVGDHSWGDGNALLLEVLVVDALDDLGARGPNAAVRTAISIADADETLGNHVKVEVGQNLVGLLGGEALRVEARSKETVLLGTPPGKTDLVLGAIVAGSFEQLKKQTGAGAWGFVS